MQIQTNCACNTKYAFAKHEIGKRFRCPTCDRVLEVPPPGQKATIVEHDLGAVPRYYPNAANRNSSHLPVLVAGLAGLALVVFVVFLLLTPAKSVNSKTIEMIDVQDSATAIDESKR